MSFKFKKFPRPSEDFITKHKHGWYITVQGWVAELIKFHVINTFPKCACYGVDHMTRVYETVRLEICFETDEENAEFIMMADAGAFDPKTELLYGH